MRPSAPSQGPHCLPVRLPGVHPFQSHVPSRAHRRILCHTQDGKSAGADDFWRVSSVVGFPSNAAANGRQSVSLASPSSTLPTMHGQERLGAPVAPLTTPGAPAPAPHVPSELSWQQWLSHFEQADSAAERREQLALELKDALRQESYSAASQIQAELKSLDAQDAVSCIRRQLEQALAQERYADAAQLRDAGLSGLAGWWAGQAEDDPVGHLLHITPEYSRWTGRVFRPRDIAELKVQKLDVFGRQPLRPSFGPSRPSGSPVLEVFLRPEGGAGAGGSSSSSSSIAGTGSGSGAGGRSPRYLHQAVSLRLPTSEEVERRRMWSSRASSPPPPPPSPSYLTRPSSPPGGASGSRAQAAWPGNVPPPPLPHTLPGSGTATVDSGVASSVHLSISVRRDGSARIAGMRPAQQQQQHTPAPAPAPSDSIQEPQLPPWSSPSPTPFSPASGPTAGSAWYIPEPQAPTPQPEAEPAAWQLPDYATDDIIDISSQHAMASLDAEDGAVLLPDPGAGGLGLPLYNALGGASNSLYPIDGLEDLYEELMRVPARVEMLGRDQMVYHMPEDPATASTIFGRPATMPPTPGHGHGATSGWAPAAGLFGSQQGRAQYSAGGTAASAGSANRAAPGYAPGATLESLSLDEGEPVHDEGVASIEVVLPISGAAGTGRGSSEGVDDFMCAPPTEAVAAEVLNVIADQVAQSMEARVGSCTPREEIAEALREVVRRIVCGEPCASAELHAGRTADAPSPAASIALQYAELPPAAPPKTTSIFYKRLPLERSHADPLSGLYLGSFGPHGPELLQLSRGIEDGEEVVNATKVTGDANVPAGVVSFRAKVGRRHRLDSRQVYPDELGVTARYRGEGRVAQRGFAQPRWVEGELLVFGSKGNALTAGAQLGFVWEVPGEKRFLILLNRVDLS